MMSRAANAARRHGTERRFHRHKVDAKLRMHVFLGDDCTLLVHGRCHQLGRGGMGAMLNTQLRCGESVWVETLSFSGYAIVRYSKGWYHGFEFTLLRQNDRARVDSLCDSYASEPEPQYDRIEPFGCGNVGSSFHS